MSRLTKALELPHQVDSACASVAGIITMDKFAEVGQLCSYTEARRDHNDGLILSHWYTSSMGSAEQSQARHGNALIKCSVTEEFTSQSSPRLDEKLQCVLFSVGPVGYYERMALQERPEADGGNP